MTPEEECNAVADAATLAVILRARRLLVNLDTGEGETYEGRLTHVAAFTSVRNDQHRLCAALVFNSCVAVEVCFEPFFLHACDTLSKFAGVYDPGWTERQRDRRVDRAWVFETTDALRNMIDLPFIVDAYGLETKILKQWLTCYRFTRGTKA